MNIQELKTWSEIESHPTLIKEWSGLLKKTPINTIFQTYEWHNAWWKTFHKKYKLSFLTARDEAGTLVGIFPLCLVLESKSGFKAGDLAFIGTPNFASDYCDFIYDQENPEVIQSFVDWVSQNTDRWKRLFLFNFRDHSPSLDHFTREASERKFKLSFKFLSEAPARILGNEKEDQQVLKKKSLKRHYNSFKREGDLAFSDAETPEQVTLPTRSVFSSSTSREGNSLGTKVNLKIQQKKSSTEHLLKIFFLKKWLKFSTVKFNDDVLAYHFGFVYEQQTHLVQAHLQRQISEKVSRRSPSPVSL